MPDRQDGAGRFAHLPEPPLAVGEDIFDSPDLPGEVERVVLRALAKAGLSHHRFHDLRHSAATFLLGQGFTLEDVKNLLGHSSIVLTSNTYGHVLEQRQREVAMGMDAVLGG